MTASRWAARAIPVLLLLVALLPMPFDYYVLLRWVVCGFALLALGIELGRRPRLSGWGAGLAIAAVLFNPVLPVPFPQRDWAVLDVLAALLFVAYGWRARRWPLVQF